MFVRHKYYFDKGNPTPRCIIYIFICYTNNIYSYYFWYQNILAIKLVQRYKQDDERTRYFTDAYRISIMITEFCGVLKNGGGGTGIKSPTRLFNFFNRHVDNIYWYGMFGFRNTVVII